MYVLMISPNNFPNNDAGAVRDGYFGKIYMELGYDVIHIGMNPREEHGVWNNIEYFSLFSSSSNMLHKLGNNINYRNRLTQKINSIYKEKGQPSIIHIYDIPITGFLWAKKEAKRLNIPIIHDSVEWYSPCEFRFGRFSYPYILKEITNRFLVSRQVTVISISSYLNNYYLKKGIKSIRIPVIMEPSNFVSSKKKDNEKIKIVYAGSPAKKDYLSECIIAFSKLPANVRKAYEFNIYGADTIFVKNIIGEVPDGLYAHGRVTRAEVLDALSLSDFAILLRPQNERYTKAGFPTKLVEAMTNGCAMICNYTSDLHLYLNDNNNSIIVSDSTVDKLIEVLTRLSTLPRNTIDTIKYNAYLTAKECFDYKKYIPKVKQLIDSKTI